MYWYWSSSSALVCRGTGGGRNFLRLNIIITMNNNTLLEKSDFHAKLTLARYNKRGCSFDRELRQLRKTQTLSLSHNQLRTSQCLFVLELLVDRLQLLAADVFVVADWELLKR